MVDLRVESSVHFMTMVIDGLREVAVIKKIDK